MTNQQATPALPASTLQDLFSAVKTEQTEIKSVFERLSRLSKYICGRDGVPLAMPDKRNSPTFLDEHADILSESRVLLGGCDALLQILENTLITEIVNAK